MGVSKLGSATASKGRGVFGGGKPRQALDRVAVALMGVLAIATLMVLLLGDHSTVRVQKFSWQDATVGLGDRAFVLNFNRPMAPETVEENLVIAPPLPGRISWSGRRMAYTLDVPIPYGESFRVELAGARDRFGDADQDTFEPFQATFRSRDRAFAYIGTEGDEQGRLVLVNLSREGDTSLLTPPELTVLDFQPYPLGERILFSALDQSSSQSGRSMPGLYQVTTGLRPRPPAAALGEGGLPEPAPGLPGEVTPLLPDDGFQTLAFDLAPNGRTIVVQRVNVADPTEFGPWLLEAGQDPRPLTTEPGGEFLIAPDSATLLMLQGQGTAVIPLDVDPEGGIPGEPLDFLPEYGRVFDLTSDGLSAAMVDFNQNNPDRRFTESLVLVSSRGDEEELLNVDGSIMDAQFDPSDRILYALSSKVLPGELYQEQVTVSAINLESPAVQPLVTFPPQTQVTMSLAPDGLALLLAATQVQGDQEEAATTHQIWLLPLFATGAERRAATPVPLSPEPLPLSGSRPTWLP